MTEDFFKDLSPAERKIIVDKGTEAPFTGEYDAFYEAGVFVCRACSNPLYDSSAKFDAGCGWPAFHSEHNSANIARIEDYTHGMIRIEVRCSKCDAHFCPLCLSKCTVAT